MSHLINCSFADTLLGKKDLSEFTSIKPISKGKYISVSIDAELYKITILDLKNTLIGRVGGYPHISICSREEAWYFVGYPQLFYVNPTWNMLF